MIRARIAVAVVGALALFSDRAEAGTVKEGGGSSCSKGSTEGITELTPPVGYEPLAENPYENLADSEPEIEMADNITAESLGPDHWVGNKIPVRLTKELVGMPAGTIIYAAKSKGTVKAIGFADVESAQKI